MHLSTLLFGAYRFHELCSCKKVLCQVVEPLKDLPAAKCAKSQKTCVLCKTWNGLLLNFAFLIEPFHLHFFLTLRLLYLTMLVFGALLSSFLEEALYKCSI